VSWYQKKHLPTHTYCGHQSSIYYNPIAMGWIMTQDRLDFFVFDGLFLMTRKQYQSIKGTLMWSEADHLLTLTIHYVMC